MTHRDSEYRPVDDLLEQLDVHEQLELVEKLAGGGGEDAVRSLVELVECSVGRYDRRMVTVAAIRALGKLKAKEALPVLLKALDSRLFNVKGVAALAIGGVGADDRAVEKMEEVLTSDVPKEVKQDVIEGLGQAETGKAVQPLAAAVRRESDPEIKKNAIHALGKTRRNEAVTPLMEFLYREADEKVRAEAIRALGEVLTSDAVEALETALGDPSPGIRSCAALALAESSDPAAENRLKRMLDDPNEKVARSAAMGLGLLLFGPGRNDRPRTESGRKKDTK